MASVLHSCFSKAIRDGNELEQSTQSNKILTIFGGFVSSSSSSDSDSDSASLAMDKKATPIRQWIQGDQERLTKYFQ